ncbi:hypothetical protein QUB80_12815, partial [Chlorogloeopsis sp. ULAP01]|nr:hypothetical protein [Chlorogloeopsis sp. ULAP01]
GNRQDCDPLTALRLRREPPLVVGCFTALAPRHPLSSQDGWLRWCYQDGAVLPTGDERAQQLAEQLRAMGIDLDTL